MGPHQSGLRAGTSMFGDEMIRSGSPICHSFGPANTSGGGRSAGLPRGAPLSAHQAICAISFAVSDRSPLNRWMPTSFSMYQGGMASCPFPSPVRYFMARAQGRASS